MPTSQCSATPPDSALRTLLPMGLAALTPSTLASVSDAFERLQRERDLALRRNRVYAEHFTVDGRRSIFRLSKKCMRLFDDRRSNTGNQLTTCSFHCKYVDV